ncbi:phospholipase D-like domain-containing protein [Rossellomorea aquimaris]|uniref:phospholipase D-like domain-containing protein n=1 Tax=Rossellomorea aquimaris TaxID=189382 RepID=UPI001CFCD756|nr:phospholipase D-like domain-containing protein [Rossellomorea aquimaris]
MINKWLQGLVVIAGTLVTLFLIMHWDVRHGVKNYTKNHPMTETLPGNASIDIFNTGNSFYNSLFKDIESADHHIWIHFFIIRDDRVSNDFFDALIDKASSGVDVRLSVDYLGSDIHNDTIKQLKNGGVKVLKSRPLSFKNLFYSLHHRNHRRLISIDEDIAYIGGFNMGVEYLGEDPKLGYWRDYHLRLKGSSVKEVYQQFKRDWIEDGGGIVKSDQSDFPSTDNREGNVHFIFSTGTPLIERTIEWIDGANESVTITTPYFIPNKMLVEALEKAAKRGVVVNILVPDDTDAWFTKPPSYRIEKNLLKVGVNLYLYQKGFFHGKVMVIDHKWADVGTANWDPRSLHLNDESNCIIRDEGVAMKLESLINKDIKDSEKLTRKAFDELPSWEKALQKTPQWLYYYF